MIANVDAISYSGPTYVAIRSAKHETSNAFTHHWDMNQILAEAYLKPFLKRDNGDVIPCWYIRTDGAADENPRHVAVLRCEICFFRENDLDHLAVCRAFLVCVMIMNG